MKPLLLIIDDDNEFISDFSLHLTDNYNCISANNGTEGLLKLTQKNPDVILLDLMFKGGENGIDILKKIREIDADIPVLMVTDYASVDTAIEAIKLGATDYISKTPNLKELHLIIEKSLKERMKNLRTASLESEINDKFKEIIGSSEAMQNLKQNIALYAKNNNTVLITGESGVGKELVARKIHELSERKTSPFLAVNCAAIPNNLIESELFGYERGAFSGAEKRKPGKFELAENGTIFLDEVAELSLDSQVKLLRVLQEKEFERVGGTYVIKSNCRIIAATNQNLKEMVKHGEFREDLYYRLDVLPLRVPPLRERLEDIPELVEHFVRLASIELKIKPKKIPGEIIEAFCNYDWPGNIRELQNYVTRMIILPGEITIADIPFATSGKKEYGIITAKVPKTWDQMDKMRKEAADKAAREIEKLFLENLLGKFNGNISKAAEHIGINRSNLHKMINKCGL
ncbi:MAG: sigma-54-dependent Fis family transcriptional regulator [Ignavibacteria bacterium]|nr:MAG: sigma-54-dependent Fis family transcriptional regulator [Ignavibacteria bacterium]